MVTSSLPLIIPSSCRAMSAFLSLAKPSTCFGGSHFWAEKQKAKKQKAVGPERHLQVSILWIPCSPFRSTVFLSWPKGSFCPRLFCPTFCFLQYLKTDFSTPIFCVGSTCTSLSMSVWNVTKYVQNWVTTIWHSSRAIQDPTSSYPRPLSQTYSLGGHLTLTGNLFSDLPHKVKYP